MLRRNLLFALALLLTLTLAACSGSSAGTATPQAPTATPTAEATPSVTPEATLEATPSGTPAGILLAPPDFTLTAAAGEQPSSRGSFYWMLDNGLAAELNYHGFEIHPSTLEVQPGETLTFAPNDGHVPATLELAIFPEEGNTGPITPEILAAEAGATPTTTATPTPAGGEEVLFFRPKTDPVKTAELQGDDMTWTVDLEPGTYFIRIKGTWPNPVVPEKERWGEFAFTVQVP